MPGVPCATRCFRCGARWRLRDRKRARVRLWLRPRPRLRESRPVPSNLDSIRSDRTRLGQSQGPSRRRNRPQPRLHRVSLCVLPSRSELRRQQPRPHRCHRAGRRDPRRRHVRPIHSLVRPQRPCQGPPVPPLLRPQLRRPLFARPLRRLLLASRLRHRQPAPNRQPPRFRHRLRPDLQAPRASARPTPSSRRIRRSRQSGLLERSSRTWSCTIPASARKGFATGT